MTPDQVRQIVREELSSFVATDRYKFQKHLQVFDGKNIQVGRGTGTKIGTGTDQKLSVYGVTPIVQQSAIGGPAAQGASYNQSDANTIVTAVNSIRTALKNFGIIA